MFKLRFQVSNYVLKIIFDFTSCSKLYPWYQSQNLAKHWQLPNFDYNRWLIEITCPIIFDDRLWKSHNRTTLLFCLPFISIDKALFLNKTFKKSQNIQHCLNLQQRTFSNFIVIFSQNYKTLDFYLLSHLLMTSANSLDPDKAWKNVRPDVDPNSFTLWWHSWKNFLKMLILKTNQQTTKNHAKLPNRQRV